MEPLAKSGTVLEGRSRASWQGWGLAYNQARPDRGTDRTTSVKHTPFELWNLVSFLLSFSFSPTIRERKKKVQSKINSLKYLCSISCDSACRSVHNARSFFFFFPFSLVGIRIDRSWKLRVGSRRVGSRAVTPRCGRPALNPL